jgi:hypothetical protein
VNHQPHQAGTSVPQLATSSVDLEFAITPIEHVKYHELFLNYDTNKDGFLFFFYIFFLNYLYIIHKYYLKKKNFFFI